MSPPLAAGASLALVGRAVDYETSPGTSGHGTIARVRHSLFGEPSVIIHPTVRPGQVATDLVLFGRLAAELISRAQRDA